MKRNASNKKPVRRNKKFTVPAVVQVGGHNIGIFIDAQTDIKLISEQAVGLYLPVQKAIAIRTDLTEGSRGETYFHELMEAINDIYELGLKHRTIQTIGAALHQARLSEEGGA